MTASSPSSDDTLDTPAPVSRFEHEAVVGALRVTYAAGTEIGHVRETNEDGYATRAGRLFVVADGMGGHAAGEVAAGLALEEMKVDFLAMSMLAGLALVELGRAVRNANTAVYRENQRRLSGVEEPGARRRMGCALTAALLCDGGRLVVAHVGDTRAYRLRGGALEQLTEDHRVEGRPNILTRSVGYQEDVDVDTRAIDVAPGDTILVCSDGLHELVSHHLLTAILYVNPRPGRAVTTLIDAALAEGGTDNITAIVARIEAA